MAKVMDVKLLEDALVLLEEKSLSRAAARRNVTQPAFSRRLRALEDWAGVKLLDRQANRVVLNPCLADNENEIRTVLARLAQLRRHLAKQNSRAKTVILTTQHALAGSVFPKFFKGFSDPRPELSWRLRTLNRDDCISVFMRGDADLLLCYEARGFPPLPFDESIERRLWMRDALIPVVADSRRQFLGDDHEIPVGFPMVAYPPESHFGRLVEEMKLHEPLFQQGAEIHVETAFSIGVRELIRNGAGIGWVPHSMCHADLVAGNLVNLSRRYGSVPLDISIFSSNGNVIAKEFLETISLIS